MNQPFPPLSPSSVRLRRQLTVFIGLRAGECAASVGVPASAVNLWPEDGWSGALQAIPIYICAFGCHFNVLPVHGELAKPTRERLHRLVGGQCLQHASARQNRFPVVVSTHESSRCTAWGNVFPGLRSVVSVEGITWMIKFSPSFSRHKP